MPYYVASYDLKKTTPDPYAALITHAEKAGWRAVIPMTSGRIEKLPNTTLVGTFVNLDQAVSALEAARYAAANDIGGQVYVTGCYVSEVVGHAFLKPKESEPSLADALSSAMLRRQLI